MAGFQSFPTSIHTAMNKFFSLYGSRLLAVFVLQSWTWLPAMLMFSKYKALYETSGLDCSHSEAAFKTISDWNQRSQNEPKFVHGNLNGDGKNVCQSWLSESIFVIEETAERIYELPDMPEGSLVPKDKVEVSIRTIEMVF